MLIAFLLLGRLAQGEGLKAAVGGAVFVVAIFATVVLHEFGHAFAARHYGIRTKDITLLPIGGIARLERLPDVPRQELWVALAGPAVNVVIAVIGWLLVVALALGNPDLDLRSATDTPLGRFVAVNVWLAVFNMIPAFPMDGGRALRALLAERLEYVRATEIAANLGQGLALVFGFLGLFSNPFLVFIALFVWMGATGESASVSVRSAIAGIPVSRAMITDFRTLAAVEPLQRAAELVISGSQQDFPVVEDDGRVVGILTRDTLVRALSERGLAGFVGDVMTRTFQTADARELLEQAFARLQECACPVLPVLDNGRLVGLITADNVGEYVMIRGALKR
ncbi:MAG: site-2 protease family protein [Vicinamibacterales bacterium]|nr:site-2 protease family protein [Vicinamibacterales bacterium]